MSKVLFLFIFGFFLSAQAANEMVIVGGTDLNLGSVEVGKSSVQAYTLMNAGTQNVYFYEFFFDFTKNQIAFNGNGDFPGTGTCTGASIAPGASCTFVVKFAPASATNIKANLKINYFYGNSSVVQKLVMTLRGVGVIPTPVPPPTAALLKISDGPVYDFGAVATGSTPNEKTFIVTNTGGSTAFKIASSGVFAPFTLIGGTCGVNLTAGATCTLIVDYSPVTAGPASATLTLNYFDGETNQFTTRPLQGTAVAPANLLISDGPSYDFGTLTVGIKKSHTFTVTNTGQISATQMLESVLAKPFAYVGGVYPGTGGTCADTLAPAASCQLVVEFAPASGGVALSQLSVAYFDGAVANQSVREVRGTGLVPIIPASLSISEAPTYDFGSVTLGGSVSKAFTVINSGGSAATQIAEIGLSNAFTFLGGVFPGTGGTCSNILSAGGSCTVVVSFAPMAAGPASGSLVLQYFNALSFTSASRPLIGEGVAPIDPAVLTLSDGPSYDFGTVTLGQSTLHTFTVTNSGGSEASQVMPSGLSAPFAFLGGTFPGTGGTCSAQIAAGSSCTLVVQFAPMAVGMVQDTLSLAYFNGVASAAVNREVRGEGVAPIVPALLTISDGPTYDFGPVTLGHSTAKLLLVTNSGGSIATQISEVTLAAPFSFMGGTYPGSSGTCGAALAPAATCTVVIEFAPTAVGLANSTLTLEYFDAVSNASASRDVSGKGVAPVPPPKPAILSISDAPELDFGGVLISQSTARKLTVTNSGETEATGIMSAALSGAFSYEGGVFPGTQGTCSDVLAVQASCTLMVRFAPRTSGAHADTVSLNYFDGQSVQTVVRALNGQGLSPAKLKFTNSDPQDFGVVKIGSKSTRTLELINTGDVPATKIAMTGFTKGFSKAGGNCTEVLLPNQKCLVVVDFAPASVKKIDVDLKTSYRDGLTLQGFAFQLHGVGKKK